MTNVEFKALLKEVFEGHMLMKNRNYHTVNELLHVLRYDDKFKDLQGVNITVLADTCMCIPCLDAFVDIRTLGVWFDDSTLEFESDECEYEGRMMRFDNITVHEREER